MVETKEEREKRKKEEERERALLREEKDKKVSIPERRFPATPTKFQIGGIELSKEEFDVARGKGGVRTPRLEEAEKASRLAGEAGIRRKEEEVLMEKFEGVAPELAEKFGEAGVFEEPVLEPIISREQENLGVILDIGLSLIPDFGEKLGIKALDPRGIKRRIAKERITETEIAMESFKIDKVMQTEIGKSFDNEIDETIKGMEVVEFGLGIGGGILIGWGISIFAEPIKQWIGDDKKVKNLTTGLVKFETIISEIESVVVAGDMPYNDGLRRIQYIESIIDNFEAELKLASIQSANVRISLKGRDIEGKILSARIRANGSKRAIGGAEIAGIITPSPTQQKMAVWSNLEKMWKEGE